MLISFLLSFFTREWHCCWCRRADVKVAMPVPSGVWWLMKNRWDQATGWSLCFSVLTLLVSYRKEWYVMWPVKTWATYPLVFRNKCRRKLKGNWPTQLDWETSNILEVDNTSVGSGCTMLLFCIVCIVFQLHGGSVVEIVYLLLFVSLLQCLYVFFLNFFFCNTVSC